MDRPGSVCDGATNLTLEADGYRSTHRLWSWNGTTGSNGLTKFSSRTSNHLRHRPDDTSWARTPDAWTQTPTQILGRRHIGDTFHPDTPAFLRENRDLGPLRPKSYATLFRASFCDRDNLPTPPASISRTAVRLSPISVAIPSMPSLATFPGTPRFPSSSRPILLSTFRRQTWPLHATADRAASRALRNFNRPIVRPDVPGRGAGAEITNFAQEATPSSSAGRCEAPQTRTRRLRQPPEPAQLPRPPARASACARVPATNTTKSSACARCGSSAARTRRRVVRW